MNTTLTLDFGLKLGWCVGSTVSDVSHGMKKLSEGSRQSHGYRWINLTDFLEKTFEEHKVRRVIYESVRRHEGVSAAHVYGGMLAVLQYNCIRHAIFFEHIEVSSIKKAFTGNGSAKKQDMMRECAARGFAGIDDDNESDAVAIWCVDYEKRVGARAERLKQDAWS